MNKKIVLSIGIVVLMLNTGCQQSQISEETLNNERQTLEQLDSTIVQLIDENTELREALLKSEEEVQQLGQVSKDKEAEEKAALALAASRLGAEIYDKHYHFMEVHGDKAYVLYRRENPDDSEDWSDELWCLCASKSSVLLFEAKGIDFRVSSDNKNIAVSTFGENIYILNADGKVKKKFNIDDFKVTAYSDLSLDQWNSNGDVLWVQALETYKITELIHIKMPTWETKVYTMPSIIGVDYAFNPDTGWLAYSNYPLFLDTLGAQAYNESDAMTTLSLYNLDLEETLIVDTAQSNEFTPKWDDQQSLYYKINNETKHFELN